GVEEEGNLVRVVLAVAVEEDEGVVASVVGVLEGAADAVPLAFVAGVLEDGGAGHGGEGDGLVLAAVVDDQHLVGEALGAQDDAGDGELLVVAGDGDEDAGASAGDVDGGGLAGLDGLHVYAPGGHAGSGRGDLNPVGFPASPVVRIVPGLHKA